MSVWEMHPQLLAKFSFLEFLSLHWREPTWKYIYSMTMILEY